MKILIMGHSGAGKTTLAGSTASRIQAAGKTVTWLNADKIRKQYDDWDFSIEGRIRQSLRMAELAAKYNTDYLIADFIAPLPENRDNFGADCIVWVDTVQQSKYMDTNQLFVPPETYDIRVTEQDSDKWSRTIVQHIGHKNT